MSEMFAIPEGFRPINRGGQFIQMIGPLYYRLPEQGCSIIALRIHTKSDDNIGGYTLIAPSVTTLAAESVFRLTIPCC